MKINGRGESEKTNPKRTQNKPNLVRRRRIANECKLFYNKGLWKKWHFRSPGKQSQNKANLLDAQMNATSFITKEYENERLCRLRENKPNSNPIKLEANLPLRGRRSLRVSFSESSNRGPISNSKRSADPYGWASRNPQTGDQFQRQKNARFRTIVTSRVGKGNKNLGDWISRRDDFTFQISNLAMSLPGLCKLFSLRKLGSENGTDIFHFLFYCHPLYLCGGF